MPDNSRRRLQVELGPKAIARLNEAMQSTEARTRVDVIRNALKLYLWIADQVRDGYRVSMIKRKDGGEGVEVELPGVGFD